MIECLEQRALLSATAAAADNTYEAAAAQVERIQASQTNAAANRQALREALRSGKAAVRQVLTSARPVLTEDLQALRQARASGDAAAIDAAEAKLAADRAKL